MELYCIDCFYIGILQQYINKTCFVDLDKRKEKNHVESYSFQLHISSLHLNFLHM